MSGNQKERIEEIIENGYDFKFGEYISQGFEMVQKELGNFILFTLVMFLITSVVGFIPIVGSLVNNLLLVPVFTAGYYLVCRKIDQGERIEFGQFFKGFDKVGPIVLVTLVGGLITLASTLPFFLAIDAKGIIEWYMNLMQDPTIMSEDPTFLDDFPGVPFWSFFLLIFAVYFTVAYVFALPLVWFYNLSFWDALETSRKLVTKNWFVFFGFSIVLAVFLFLGALMCCVGLLAALPLMYCCYYIAFADITQLNNEPDENAGIEQHLIE